MGTFVFKWAHPASEVYVTGTFDDWQKTEQLEKVGDHFEKDVVLADASKKIYYKFVVDGDWVTDHTAPKENDESGNENNVLTPERIITMPATMSSAAPESTTAALAGAVPLEKNKSQASSDLPGAFPETPAAELGQQEFGVNPLPATAGAVNPITLAPGEKIPEDLTTASTTDNVRLDPESYEKSDALPGGVSPFVSSAGPTSTTAELAASVPREVQVPEIVKESQMAAHVEPEASAIPAEVQDKAEVESELLAKVKEAPSTSEGTAGKGTEKTEATVSAGEAAASIAAAATAVGAAVFAAAVSAKDTVVASAAPAATTAQETIAQQAAGLPESVKEKLPVSVQEQIPAPATKETTIQEVAPQVPAEVKESIAEAGESPEAAANAEAVAEKTAVEQELLKEVKEVEPVEVSAGETSAPAAETSTPVIDPVTKPVGLMESTPATTTPAATTAEETKAVPNGAAATTVTTETPATTTAAISEKRADNPTTPAKSLAVPASTTSTPASTTTTEKKKNRLSAFISKIKSKAK
ncbi:Glycogen recognition site of AMP-activated protein kinase [Microdochium nivale]|nr:Glycogen recognition site of AMP-activated protein kinase [Microdochium nivale]